MITINKRVRWAVTLAAILLLIILWVTKGQEERKVLKPVRPGKTEPMPDDNRVYGKYYRDRRWA
jgi:hypothetical protein